MSYLLDHFSLLVEAVEHSADEFAGTTVWTRNHEDAGELEQMLHKRLNGAADIDLVMDEGRWGVTVKPAE